MLDCKLDHWASYSLFSEKKIDWKKGEIQINVLFSRTLTSYTNEHADEHSHKHK